MCTFNTVLVGLSRVKSDRLEDANYYTLRTLFRTKNERYESFLDLAGTNTLKHRRYNQSR